MSQATSTSVSGNVTFGSESPGNLWLVGIVAVVLIFALWLLNRK